MADINSDKNGIIIQPITLKIRAPFQFLTNQRAIKRMHYSELRDGLKIAAAISQLRVREGSTLLDCFIQRKGCNVEQISPIFLPLFEVQKSIRFVPCQPACQVLYI